MLKSCRPLIRSPNSCATSSIIGEILEVIEYLGSSGMFIQTCIKREMPSQRQYTAFSVLRIWAIWERAWPPTIAVFLLSAYIPVIEIVSKISRPEPFRSSIYDPLSVQFCTAPNPLRGGRYLHRGLRDPTQT